MIKVIEREEYLKKFEHVYDPCKEVDFYLENGQVLYKMDWNGEKYTVKEEGREKEYTPVYVEMFGDYEIVGFIE